MYKLKKVQVSYGLIIVRSSWYILVEICTSHRIQKNIKFNGKIKKFYMGFKTF